MNDSPPSRKISLPEKFADAKPVISTMAKDFIVARDVQAHEKALQEAFDRLQDEIKLSDDTLTTLQQISRPINNYRLPQAAQAERKRRAKTHDSFMFMTYLQQMCERITDLKDQMAKRYEVLRGKYSDNVIGAMAATFLTRKELSGLETDAQMLQALTNKILDENGKIKDQYKDLEEAKYVRDWQEARKLKAVVAKYDGRDYLTTKEQRDVGEAADQASLTDNTNMNPLIFTRFKSLADQAHKNAAISINSVFKPVQHIHFLMQDRNNAGWFFFRVNVKNIVMFAPAYSDLRITLRKAA